MHNILLLTGGGGTEHEISIISAQYIKSQIDKERFNIIEVEINKQKDWIWNGQKSELSFDQHLKTRKEKIKIDAVIPCLHGFPGETGDIQGMLEVLGIPFLGCGSQGSIFCFNKLVTKLLLENAGLKTTPFLNINPAHYKDEAELFLETHGDIFVKATNQGSSVGCYKITGQNKELLHQRIKEALTLSSYVILEKAVVGRELELSAFEFNNEVHLTKPGEILTGSEFYDYEDKYSEQSTAKTIVEAENIPRDVLGQIFEQAKTAFAALQIRHLARIDFFYSVEGEVFINEVNTFPGHTKISMFPMMMENYGVKYSDFINQHLYHLVQKH
ncbi:MAG: D-alanine--D-alanine ligase [Halobacteriovoraceae bacterium]|nr:D-alanine--D-alanine ligase [Halobacteriovoraceae bacterium]|tara:strand:+ start:5220 stop:6206 length:987 start_codon:yes stop_codon:yes gene_type:complete